MLATYTNLNTAGNAQHTGQIQAKLIIIAFLIAQQQGCSGLFKLSQFYQQLRRRRVLSTILPYLVIVWLALQVVAVVSQLLQLPPVVGNIVAISLFAALPLLLYLAWFYQYQDGRLQAIADVDGQLPATFGAKQLIMLVLLSSGCALLGYQYYLASRPAAKPEPLNVLAANSIAVLPFTQLAPTENPPENSPELANSPERALAEKEPELDLLANSLAEEISSQLGRSPGLIVAAASSGQVLSRQQLSLPQIASRLQVATLLTGSISREGQQLQIRLQLLDGQSGQTLWSQQLQRELTDIFALETEVARSVANALQASLAPGSTLQDLSANASTDSADAYLSYLKAREQYRLQTSEAMQQARSLFEQAIGQDPEYALAYVGLADALLLLADSSKEFGIIKTEIATTLGMEYLDKAIARAPQLAEAYAVKGRLFDMLQQEEQALSNFAIAIQLNPNLAIAHMWQYLTLKRSGRYDQALEALERAYQLDPVSVAIQYNRGYEQAIRGQFAEALSSFNQLVQDFPTSPTGYAGLALNAFHQGQLADSLHHWHQAWQLSPDNSYYPQNYRGLLLTLNLSELEPELATNSTYRSNYLLRVGDSQTLFAEMEFELAASPDDTWLKFEAALYQMLRGEQSEAINLLFQSYRSFSDNELYSMPMCSPAIEIAWALQQQDQTQQADKLLVQCQQRLDDAMQSELRDSYLNHLAARLAALQGDNKLAIQQLQLALAYGWREWWTFDDPIFDTIPKEQLAPLRQQLDNAISEQRQLALARAKQLAPGKQQQP
ncbi:tetratricopeptide repeat protein [Arsukibacterium perlucidum]|uniref:tetratricopeptide repeat protein n=1 Tax=Arsukibacterium perlucidum TaxID=368811 RepID=UPI00036A68A0|nr:tetratricopeptide repeat protein [Arsukibacterium perlucidum]